MFQNNQRQFHRELNQGEKYVKMRNLMPKNRKNLGGDIWNQSNEYKKNTRQLKGN